MAERRSKGSPAAGKAKAGKGAPPPPERSVPAAEQALACCDKPELSGSASGSFTYLLLRQACLALNHPARGDDPTMVEIDRAAARQFLRGVAPRDPIEGMIAAQMLGLHEAAMECLGRGAIREQYPEARHANLAQANKLTRSFAVLVEALDRHRGKGQQTVRVEHVTVNAGGQAIVGAVAQGGGGSGGKSEERPHAPGRLAPEPGVPLRGADAGGEPVSIAGGAGEGAVQDARRGGGRRRAGGTAQRRLAARRADDPGGGDASTGERAAAGRPRAGREGLAGIRGGPPARPGRCLSR
jgi:hypothetical protein